MNPHHTTDVDADFAEEVLAELYTYPRKRRWVAMTLWVFLGFFGGHRFYLDRHGTAVLMLFTGGGALFWWLIDGLFVSDMVRDYNTDQELRERVGLPPRELDFMPPLSRDVLAQPPAWTVTWRAAGVGWNRLRLAGDVMVLVVTGFLLAVIAGAAGVHEAVVTVVVLTVLTVAGSQVGTFGHLPVIHGLIRWSHRLRLFYYYNRPGTPIALLFRPVTATILAPFRRRDRAEVKLYLQLGGVFTLLFLMLDLLEAIAEDGLGALSPMSLFGLWLKEAVVTFIVIYSFATPIGAVLTLHLLMRRTHRVARALSIVVLISMVAGLLM